MLTEAQAVEWLKQQATKTTQQDYAESLGISATYLSDVLRDRREAGPILARAGWEKRTMYARRDCPACNGAGVIGMPGALCTFCGVVDPLPAAEDMSPNDLGLSHWPC